MGRLAGVKPMMFRSRSTKIEDLRHTGLLARHLWASAGCLGSSWGLLGRLASVLGMAWAFGCFFKLFWGVLGMGEASRKLTGPSVLRASWRWVEGVWVAAWAVLGASGASWVHLGCVLGRSVSEAYWAVKYTTLVQILNGSLSIF